MAVLAAVGTAGSARAQEDNSGTNPANFTYEFRWPFGQDVSNVVGKGPTGTLYGLGTKFGMRVRAKYSNLSLTVPGQGTAGVSGIGDFDARLLYLPYVSAKLFIAVGLEAFFNTATNDALGSGKTSLRPIVFAVFPGLLGKTSLFAPAYQYVFDVAGSDDRAYISRSQIDLYLVWTLAAGKNWLIVDPQVVIDHANDTVPVGTAGYPSNAPCIRGFQGVRRHV